MCQKCESEIDEEIEDKFKIVPIPESSKIKDLTGQKFGMLTCLGYAGKDDKNQHLFVFSCDCNKKILTRRNFVKRGTVKSCGCAKSIAARNRTKSSVGVRFGRLVVNGEFYKDSKKYCECVCDCGKEHVTSESALKTGGVKSCGCFKRDACKKDRVGFRFGLLTIKSEFYKDGEKYCVCDCDCGNKRTILCESLTGGATKSCGCLRSKARKDIKNQRFGALTALEPISKNKRNVVWKCVCDCGNTTNLEVRILNSMNTLSCGKCNLKNYNLTFSNEQLLKVISKRVKCSVSNSFAGKGLLKTSRTYQIIGCSPDEFREHLKSQFTEGMSFENSGKWHIDHNIPSSYAKTEEDLFYLNSFANLQPMWGAENISKSDTLTDDVEEKFKVLKIEVDKNRELRGLPSIKELLDDKSIDKKKKK